MSLHFCNGFDMYKMRDFSLNGEVQLDDGMLIHCAFALLLCHSDLIVVVNQST